MPEFRQEIGIARRPKLFGDILIVQPVSFQILTALIVLFFLAGGAVAFFGEYTRSEQAIGHLVPTNGLVKVYPRRAGIVSELLVSEGITLSKGERMALISSEIFDGGGESSDTQSKAILQNQLALLRDKRAIYIDLAKVNTDKIADERKSLDQSVEALRRQLDRQGEIVTVARDALERTRELIDSGGISQLVFEDRKRAKLNAEQTLETLKQSLAETENRRALLGSGLTQGQLDHRLSLNCNHPLFKGL